MRRRSELSLSVMQSVTRQTNEGAEERAEEERIMSLKALQKHTEHEDAVCRGAHLGGRKSARGTASRCRLRGMQIKSFGSEMIGNENHLC